MLLTTSLGAGIMTKGIISYEHGPNRLNSDEGVSSVTKKMQQRITYPMKVQVAAAVLIV